MFLHEYQSKRLLRKYGLLTPKGILLKNIKEAKKRPIFTKKS
jgi:succinyl-CoA synthetase beta subunit